MGFFANAGADACKVGMEKLKYTRFGSKLAEYPSWKDDWNQLVHLRLDAPTELLQLRSVVPSEAKIELRNLRTLADAWKYLDGKYGRKDRLTVERVEYLHRFQCLGQAKTDVARFKELQGVW